MIHFTRKQIFWFVTSAIIAVTSLVWIWPLWNEDKTNLAILETIELHGDRFTINLPDYGAAHTRTQIDARTEFVFFPQLRTPRTLSIQPADLSISQQLDQTARGPDGLVLNYRTEVGAGGSGGKEYFLYGVLRATHGSFDVFCSIQGELISENSARWCIPALHSLSPIN